MDQDPIIRTIERLSVSPGDTVVLHAGLPLTAQQIDALYNRLHRSLPDGVKALVLDSRLNPLQVIALQPEPAVEYTPGDWYQATTVDDLQRFYLSRLPDIREAAQAHGYAIGLHGSCRRDFDLIAAPWRDGASDAETLAHAIAKAACGIDRAGVYYWEQKPAGRVATSLPICWPGWHGQDGAGHIDLSVMTAVAAPQPAQGATLAEWLDKTEYGEGWRKECADTDALLQHLGLNPENCRTDGGWLNLQRVKTLLGELAQHQGSAT